jgi:uncharacterized protein YaeQ
MTPTAKVYIKNPKCCKHFMEKRNTWTYSGNPHEFSINWFCKKCKKSKMINYNKLQIDILGI